MRVCIIGSGISGLSAAFYLAAYKNTDITVFERASDFGGRANVIQGAEHCTRLFLDDYEYIFGILKEIRRSDGRTVFDTLRPIKRYCYTETSGWVEISHLYSVMAKELSLAEKLRIARSRLTSPLLAEQGARRSANRYGSLRNFSPSLLIKIAANFFRSKIAYALEGPTDEYLVHPWVQHLEEKGVIFKRNAGVGMIRTEAGGVSIYTGGAWERFDAVIVTAFVTDASKLLAASQIEHFIKSRDHIHCKCLTLVLDANEEVFAGGHPALYVRNGIVIVLQPRRRQCVVVCVKCPSIREDDILSKVREILNLEYDITDVRVRENQLPEEAIYAADHVDPGKMLKRALPHVYFAGSCMKNSYPIDSGEGAARTAFDVVQRMQDEYGLLRYSTGSCHRSVESLVVEPGKRAATPLRYALLDRGLASGLLPDGLLRAGSRYGVGARWRQEQRGGVQAQEARLSALVTRMSNGPIAESTQKANEQHYELPAEFFGLFLGPRCKYSSCLWPDGVTDLAAAEEAMLDLTCRRAGIRDGMDVLDLGCGWGALSLWLAERYQVRVLAVSNSHRQREWIEAERDSRGLTDRLQIVTADVNVFDPGRTFDRVLSVEMFEHMHNWAKLLARVADWLTGDGKAFIHVFSHRSLAYRFEGTWAAERFFTAGTMPSHELMLRFAEDLVVTQRWAVGGQHYSKTLAAWLARLDANAARALAILRAEHSALEARQLLATWRLFLIATAEMWGWRDGNEWMVSHYLLQRRAGSGKKPLVRTM